MMVGRDENVIAVCAHGLGKMPFVPLRYITAGVGAVRLSLTVANHNSCLQSNSKAYTSLSALHQQGVPCLLCYSDM